MTAQTIRRMQAQDQMRQRMRQHVRVWQHRQTCPFCSKGMPHVITLGEPEISIFKQPTADNPGKAH